MAATLTAGTKSLTLLVDPPKEADGVTVRLDFIGIKVWYSTTNGFAPPAQGTLAYEGPNTSFRIDGLTPGTTYYVKYALISEIDPSDYDVSAQLSGVPVAESVAWGDVSARPTELTDGRIASAIDASGNVVGNVGGMTAASLAAAAQAGAANRSFAGANVNDWSTYPSTPPSGALAGLQLKLDRTNKRAYAILTVFSGAPSIQVTFELEVIGATVTGFTNISLEAGAEVPTAKGSALDFATDTANKWGTNGWLQTFTVGAANNDEGYLTLDKLDGTVAFRLKVRSFAGTAAHYLSLGDRIIAVNAVTPIEVYFSPIDSADYDVLRMTNAPAQAGATVGAPTGTPVGGESAETVAARISVRRRVTGRTSWSDAAANAALPNGTAKAGDEVTQTNDSNFIETRIFDGTSWVAANEIVNGALLVTGTVTAPAIATDAITTDKIQAGAIVASKMVLADVSNVYPDFDMLDASFYSSPSGSAFSFTGNTSGFLGRRYLQLTTAGLHEVVSNWFTVDVSADYYAECSAWLSSSAAGSGTATAYLELGTMDASGVVTATRRVQVAQRTESATLARLSTTLTTTATERRARFVFERTNPAGTAAARFGGATLRRRANANLIVDGAVTADKVAANAITADKLAAGSVTTDKLVAESITAEKLEVNALRGKALTAGTYMTKGALLTAACLLNASTLNVSDTTDFPESGTGMFSDSVNDLDTFSWTGKTATTLTGCTGVQAHESGAAIVPVGFIGMGNYHRSVIISDKVNELRVYGYDGWQYTQIASIGANAASTPTELGIIETRGTLVPALRASKPTTLSTLTLYGDRITLYSGSETYHTALDITGGSDANSFGAKLNAYTPLQLTGSGPNAMQVMSGAVSLVSGSLANLALNFGDTLNGLYRATNTIWVVTNGAQAFSINGSQQANFKGSIGVKDASPDGVSAINSSVTLGANGTRYGTKNYLVLDSSETMSAARTSYAAHNRATGAVTAAARASFALNILGALNEARDADTAGGTGSEASLVTGAYNFGNALSSAGIATIRGAYNHARNGSPATATAVTGSLNVAECNDTTSSTGAITTAYGTQSNVVNTSGTITTGYLFKGEYTGTVGTKWGIHLTGDTESKLDGHLQIGGVLNSPPQVVTPAAGATVTVSATTMSLIENNTVTRAYTIALPSTPRNGQVLTVSSRGGISTLTLSGGTVYGAPTTVAAGGFFSLVYSSTTSAWHRNG